MTFAVSAMLSPFDAEELDASEKPITLPPSSSIAASKLSLVLVEGAKVAATFIMVNRMEKGQGDKGAMEEISEQFGFPVYSVVDVYDIIEYLEEKPENKENVDRIKKYLEVYGAKA